MALGSIRGRACWFCGILDVFDDSERTKGDTGERTRPADSARQIGLTILWKERLMSVEGICGQGYSNCDIKHVFNHCERTDRVTDKRLGPLDSEHIIGPEIIYN